MKTFKQTLAIQSSLYEKEGDRYYTENEIAKLSAPSEHNVNTICKVKNVVFDQINGLGQVPFNIDIFYFGFVVMMTPQNFLRLAASGGKEREEAGKNLRKEIEKGRSIGSPFLQIDGPLLKGRNGLIEVRGHEGRGRCNALKDMGMGKDLIPVHIMPTYIRARNITEDDVKYLAKNFASEKIGIEWPDTFNTFFLLNAEYHI